LRNKRLIQHAFLEGKIKIQGKNSVLFEIWYQL